VSENNAALAALGGGSFTVNRLVNVSIDEEVNAYMANWNAAPPQVRLISWGRVVALGCTLIGVLSPSFRTILVSENQLRTACLQKRWQR
jgi:hypothetical protein